MCLLKEVIYAHLPLKPRSYYFVRVTSERLSSGTWSHFLGRSGVGLANPNTREPRLGGKVVQFLQNSKPVIIAELSVMSGLDPSWLTVTWLYLGKVITLINTYVTRVGLSLKVASLG